MMAVRYDYIFFWLDDAENRNKSEKCVNVKRFFFFLLLSFRCFFWAKKTQSNNVYSVSKKYK